MSSDQIPYIRVYHTYLPSPLPSSPSFHLQLTRLKDTLMIWIGIGGPSDSILAGMDEAAGPDEKRLAGDWAVAMPSRGHIPATRTAVFRSGASDLALPMAQRLARRFPPNQIHLSLSLPPTLTSQAGPSLDPFASKVLLVLEKKLISWLGELLAQQGASAE